ncbi:TonB-dependent receptor [Pseudoalteromonas sp. NBT06-2]|uniref:TonB-dependent receptor n=1 Tax=Pseudoalteromonas sp. NBT06-2 TaxID=2025950 RepID=UPI001140B314|nr:TonB-dependent receptor [Pseudoalteromonas sp. NBT06-2]
MKCYLIPIPLCSLLLATFSLANTDTEQEIEKITVKGSKMQSELMQVPASVSVIDSQQINQARIERLTDIEHFVPNLKFSQLGEVGAQFISIRGIGANPLSENRVTVYIDDIPYRTVNDKLLMGVSQIEVLRGPQGTLYGANTEGGVIVINTKMPDTDLTAKGEISTEHYTNGSRQNTRFNVASHINEQWSARVTVSREQGDTYTQNIDPSTNNKGDIENSAILATLNYYPTERLSMSLQYAGEFNRANGIYEQTYIPMNAELYNQVFAQSNPVFEQMFGIAQINANPIASQHEYHMDDIRVYDENERSLNFKINYDWDHLSLVSVTSMLNKESYGWGAQFELTSLPFINTGGDDRRDQLFQEIRLLSPEKNGISWVTGISAYRGKREFIVGYKDIIGDATDFISLVPLEESSTDIAIFASSNIEFDNNWILTLGGRYERAKRESFRASNSAFILGGQVTAVFPQLDESGSYNEFLPKLALAYQFNEQINGYMSAAKGWQPGGFNDDAFTDEESRKNGVKFKPETIWNYEMGFKGLTQNNDLYWSISIFSSYAENWQEMNFLRDTSGKAVSTSVVINAAELNAKGLEAEFKWQPAINLSVHGSIGYTDSEYKNFELAYGKGFSGNSSIMMPKSSANVSVNYHFTDNWQAHLQLSAYGDMYLDLDNKVTQKSYEVVDANISWTLDNYRITLFADNLLNEYYFTGQAFADFTFPTEGLYFSSPAKPRRLGLSVEVDF